MKNQTIVISAMAIMSLTSCYSDIDMEKYRGEQQVVLLQMFLKIKKLQALLVLLVLVFLINAI